MTRVYKFTTRPTDLQAVEMPLNAKIISAINQDDAIQIYAEVNDTEAVTEKRYIRIAGTGHQLRGDLTGENLASDKNCQDINHFNFLGTVPLYNARLVFHVYEAKF